MEERLVHYLAGECSKEEVEVIRAWISADPARRILVARLQRLWDTADEQSLDWDINRVWDGLAARLDSDAGSAIGSDSCKESPVRDQTLCSRLFHHLRLVHVMCTTALLLIAGAIL